MHGSTSQNSVKTSSAPTNNRFDSSVSGGGRTLDQGKVEKILVQAQQKLPHNAEARKKAEGELHYLEKNKHRMRYAEFRAQGLFVGSGVVEAGCKTVIGQRLKQSGMEWSVRGANAIITLRCIMKSNRFEDYWESRVS